MKKKATFFFCAILISCLVYANDTTAVKQLHRFYAGVSFTPGVSYRYLRNNFFPTETPPTGFTTEQEQKNLIDSRNKREKISFGFDVGLKVGIRVTKFLSIETGANYSKRGYNEKFDNILFGSQWNGNGYDTSENYFVKLDYTYHYINIPIALTFNFGKKKLCGIVNVGTGFDFLIRKTNTSRSNVPGFSSQRTTEDKTGFNRFNLSPFLGIGIEYRVLHFMVLRIMPVAQMQALKNIDTPITEHLWSVGINTSLLFGFKKIK